MVGRDHRYPVGPRGLNAPLRGRVEVLDVDQVDGAAGAGVRDEVAVAVAGWMPVDEFASQLAITLEDGASFNTVAGLVINRAKNLPHLGQHLKIDGWNFEIIDMDGKRIDKILVSKAIANTDSHESL